MSENNKSSLALKKSVCVSVSFMQSLLFTLLAACLCILLVLTPLFIKASFKKSDYVDLAVKEMITDLNDLAIPSGLPSDFFNDKFSEEDKREIYQLALKRISSDIKQSGYTVDIEPIKNKFKGHIEDFAAEHLGSSDAISPDAIEQLLNECATIYKIHARPAAIRRFFAGLGQILIPLIILLLVAIALIVAIFIFLNKLCSKKEFGLYCFSFLLGSGLMTGLLPCYLLITGTIRKIGFASDSLREFFITFLEGSLIVFVIAAVVLAALSVLCLLFSSGKLSFKKPLKTLDKTE